MIKQRIVVTTGKYTDKSGTEKKRYQTIGHVHSGQYGDYVTLEPGTSLAGLFAQQQTAGIGKPGDGRLYANLYDEDGKGAAKPETQPVAGGDAPAAEFSDDIPF